MIVKLLTEHNLEFLTLKGDCRGSSESTLVKMSNCWKSHALAQLFSILYVDNYHSTRQSYQALVILSICSLQGLEKTYIMFKCKFQSKAKIRYRYNQVPHLTQDSIWESDRSKRKCRTQ